MCDTLGFIHGSTAVFGKNSDRSPNEPQVLEYLPAAVHEEETVQTTYIPVKQVRETYGVLLSRPTWLWGAEIGVNDCGVCIGNEAVWTLGSYGKTGLTGMDLVRLALERSATAEDAVRVITELLEEYGQGGSCGYDHDFYYDNSFLIMDRQKLFVLETAGKKWVCKQYTRTSISNRLSIGKEGDRYSGGKAYDFAGLHADRLYNSASGSSYRQRASFNGVLGADSVSDVMRVLRGHSRGARPFSGGSVTSCCMHFGGLVGDHTTASMVVELLPEKTRVWATGSSCPCVSLYKPWEYGAAPNELMRRGKAYWYRQEELHRRFIGKVIPAEYYAERNALEQEWFRAAAENDPDLSGRCFREEKEFRDRWAQVRFEDAPASDAFNNRWNAKNAILMKEMSSAFYASRELPGTHR